MSKDSQTKNAFGITGAYLEQPAAVRPRLVLRAIEHGGDVGVHGVHHGAAGTVWAVALVLQPAATPHANAAAHAPHGAREDWEQVPVPAAHSPDWVCHPPFEGA
eukprot:4890966-Pyramimonas_sp.AAC.1